MQLFIYFPTHLRHKLVLEDLGERPLELWVDLQRVEPRLKVRIEHSIGLQAPISIRLACARSRVITRRVRNGIELTKYDTVIVKPKSRTRLCDLAQRRRRRPRLEAAAATAAAHIAARIAAHAGAGAS